MADTVPALNPAPKPARARPLRVLPTERVSTPKHFDVLRVIASLSGPAKKPVTLQEVENIIKMKASTLALLTPFYTDTGLLQRADKGFVPHDAVVAFQRAYQWNPDNATAKLAPIIRETWFAERLLPGLSFRDFREEEAINELAEACAAGPEYKPNLTVLLEYMEAAGLILRDGGVVRTTATLGESNVNEKPANENVTPDVPAQPPPARSTVVTSFAQPTEGAIQFHVSVKVEMAEFAGWDPARITAFFGGIAQVLAAKGALEKGTTGQ